MLVDVVTETKKEVDAGGPKIDLAENDESIELLH